MGVSDTYSTLYRKWRKASLDVMPFVLPFIDMCVFAFELQMKIEQPSKIVDKSKSKGIWNRENEFIKWNGWSGTERREKRRKECK